MGGGFARSRSGDDVRRSLSVAMKRRHRGSRLLNGAASVAPILIAIAPCEMPAQVTYGGVSERYPTGSAAISDSGLVLAFDMETRLRAALRDFGPFGNHGAIGGTRTVDGAFGQGMLFETAVDRVHLEENPFLAIDGPLTIALWMRVNTLNLHQHILACDDKFALWVTPQNRVRFSDTLGHGMDTADPILTDRWYSLIAIFSGRRGAEVTPETVQLFLDGENVTMSIVNRPGETPPRWMPEALYSSDACYVGFESHQGDVAHQSLQFEGLIDDLLIFNRALTAREVRVHASRAP